MVFNSIFYSVIVGIIPTLLWLFFFLREDRYHTKPRILIFKCFLGGIIAVIISFFAENIIANFVADASMKYTYWAGFEEIVKFIIVFIIALNTSDNKDPLDPMIYCITVALGFAALENAIYIIDLLHNGTASLAFLNGGKRFIGPTLLHVLSSATIGFMLGYTYYKTIYTRIIAGIIGLAGAIALHTIFNLSIINTDNEGTLKVFGWVWGAIVVLIILFEEIKAVHPDGVHKVEGKGT